VNPAVEHLEADLDELCEIVGTSRDGAPGVEFNLHRGAWESSNFTRAMFDIILDQAGSGSSRIDDPCAACYDFTRTWNCPEHRPRKMARVKGEWAWKNPADPRAVYYVGMEEW